MHAASESYGTAKLNDVSVTYCGIAKTNSTPEIPYVVNKLPTASNLRQTQQAVDLGPGVLHSSTISTENLLMGLPVHVEHPLKSREVGQQGKDDEAHQKLFCHKGEGQHNEPFQASEKTNFA